MSEEKPEKTPRRRRGAIRLAGAIPHGVAMAHRLHLAVLKAVHRHKENGNAVAVWRNGEVVVVEPENIQIARSPEPAGT